MTAFQTTDPYVNQQALDFALFNHQNVKCSLNEISKNQAILLGFSGDIWNLGSVRHVLWLQRHSVKLNFDNIKAAIIVPNHPHELHGFYLSIPRDIKFPLLADPNRNVYEAFGIDTCGFVLVDAHGIIRKRWILAIAGVPPMRDILKTVQA